MILEVNIQSEGSISQLWNIVGRYNLVYMFIRHLYTQNVNNVTLERFCNMYKKIFYSEWGALYLSFGTHLYTEIVKNNVMLE